MEFSTERYLKVVNETNPLDLYGKVTKVVGLVIEGYAPNAIIGSSCLIYPDEGQSPIETEVVGFNEGKALLMALGDIRGIGPGSLIKVVKSKASINVGENFLGRIIDGYGNPIDNKGPLWGSKEYHIYADPLNPLEKNIISEKLDLGIRSINGLLTCGKGQRMGIFAGSGVGKSVLMGMIARNTKADVNVVALIGERGREVREFIERDLGKEGLRRSVVVAVTSDQSPLVRVRGAFIATTIAEYFRDLGLDVILMMDSVTRLAMAQREVGLAIGEPPTTKGYTPSVFAMLPKLLERAGLSNNSGSITGLYTVLVEGDDFNEPVSDAMRSILDGHLCLTRELAARNHYPAIDILLSVSRVMKDIVSDEHNEYAKKLIENLAVYKKAEDLINIGAYVKGSNPSIDKAIEMIDSINEYLKQGINERVSMEQSIAQLIQLFKKYEASNKGSE
ncbi:MAG: flagellar protein export ATPase FliI [Candidatus Schekmanbacteria bacterium]|nr:MAG: flagellar protein export ATPase FliI [Candidatus Schekmanbacteria bacterium]